MDGIRLANRINIKSNLNKNEIALLEKFERIMQAEYERVSGNAIFESGLKKLLSKLYVGVFDVEAGETLQSVLLYQYKLDDLPYAKDGTLEEVLDELYSEQQ